MEFEWQPFYEELADKLLEYHSNHNEVLAKLSQAFIAAGLPFRATWKGWEINDIDPFTVFALINRKISDIKKTLLLREIQKAFNVIADVPTDFSGIPQVDNRNPTLFTVDNNTANHINKLWTFFAIAIDRADNKCSDEAFATLYTDVERMKNTAHQLTMGLFYIRPKFYVNLDDRNLKYIFDSGAFADVFVKLNRSIRENYKDGIAYLKFRQNLQDEIVSGKRYEGFSALSLAAYEWGRHNTAGKKASSLPRPTSAYTEPNRQNLKVMKQWLERQSDTERQGQSTQRIGQENLRRYLLAKYSRCMVTRIENQELLIASHIKDWHDSLPREQLDPENVLLLAKNYDAAFDRHLITFDASDGHIIKANRITWDELNRLGIRNDARIPKPSLARSEYLKYHFDKMKAEDEKLKTNTGAGSSEKEIM